MFNFLINLLSINSVNADVMNLKNDMQKFPDYAWTWHCNIAVPMQDEGISHELSNKIAAKIMNNFFEIDTSKFPEFLYFEKTWKQK